MQERKLLVQFVTPGFVGSSDQRGEWRVPPFKALTRQWWRVLLATHDARKDSKALVKPKRNTEGKRFGHAWLQHEGKHWAMRSPLQMQLSSWAAGDLHSHALGPDPKVNHPEVKHAGGSVGALLYLGYGPLTFKGGTAIKNSPAIPPRAEAEWLWRWRDGGTGPSDKEMEWLVHLIHWFGTVGGRSRNGWGSIQLFNPDGSPVADLDDSKFLSSLSIPIERCLDLEWPHAIGADKKGPLVWTTKGPVNTWQEALKSIAEIKIAFRTPLAPGAGGVAERHLLAYPVTHHSVTAWGNQARLANQLRFKVHRVQGPQGKDRFVALAFHLPHRLPEALLKKLTKKEQDWVANNELRIWRKVHAVLDEKMARLA